MLVADDFVISCDIEGSYHQHNILHIMGDIACYDVRETSAPSREASNVKEVERQLEMTCLKLSETEINIRLFKKMVVGGVATNDVRNFAEKQALLKTMDNRVNLQLVKKAMKSKLADAYTLAHS